MRFTVRLFGKAKNLSPAPALSALADATREQTRRELIAMAVRDTLKRHSIPAGAISAEGMQANTGGRDRGMHVQLVFRRWQPSLLTYIVALEAAVRARLLRLDPLSGTWIAGVSWRFEQDQGWPQLPSGQWTSQLPQAMPPGSARASLNTVLRKGDQAFDTRSVRHPEFSPTLPMTVK